MIIEVLNLIVDNIKRVLLHKKRRYILDNSCANLFLGVTVMTVTVSNLISSTTLSTNSCDMVSYPPHIYLFIV